MPQVVKPKIYKTRIITDSAPGFIYIVEWQVGFGVGENECFILPKINILTTR